MKSAKEQATEILDSFNTHNCKEWARKGKESAVRAVEYILYALPCRRKFRKDTLTMMEELNDDPKNYELPYSTEFEYWLDVRLELLKMKL